MIKKAIGPIGAIFFLFATPIVMAQGILNSRIVNGVPVISGQFPFIVGIQRPSQENKNNPYGHWCGGALISSLRVLTAAHCFANRKVDGTLVVDSSSEFTVTAGITNYADLGAQKRNVTAIAVHPSYNGGSVTNGYDVAILYLDKPITGMPYAQLATSGNDKAGSKYIVAGWGATFSGDPTTPVEMRKGNVKSITGALCKKSFDKERDITIGLDDDLQICATSKPVDTCQGDSGGPLFEEINGQFVEAGITSWGIGCSGETPGVYTRISNPEITKFINYNN